MTVDVSFYDAELTDEEKFNFVYNQIGDARCGKTTPQENVDIFARALILYKSGYKRALVLIMMAYEFGVGVEVDQQKSFILSCYCYNHFPDVITAKMLFYCFSSKDYSSHNIKVEDIVAIAKKEGIADADLSSLDSFRDKSIPSIVECKMANIDVEDSVIKAKLKKQYEGYLGKVDKNPSKEKVLEIIQKAVNSDDLSEVVKDVDYSVYDERNKIREKRFAENKAKKDAEQTGTIRIIKSKQEDKTDKKIKRKNPVIKKDKKVQSIKDDELFKELSASIKGQDEAISEVVLSKRVKQFGWNKNTTGPRAKYFFYGYTGTGKTSLAQAIANAEYGKKAQNILVLSMENYTSEAGVNRLIGSSQGYVDSGKGGVLTNALARDNEIVIVFDEIEKADDTVIQSLLGLLERGVIYDGLGNCYDATKSTLIFTSNVGTKEVMEANVEPGSKEEQEIFKKQIAKRFSPEFLGRIPTQVLFQRLSRDALKDLLLAYITDMNDNNPKNIIITLQDSAIEAMLNEEEIKTKNVRGLKENIQNKLLKNILLSLSGDCKNREFEIYYKNGEYLYNEYEIEIVQSEERTR